MTHLHLRVWIAAASSILISSCGGGGGDASNPIPPPPQSTYSVGGTVTGLVGSVTLQNNGADALVLSANGSFTFSTRLGSGSPYSVTIATQPSGPDCVVANGSGTATAAVSTVAVTCTVSAETRYLPFLAIQTASNSPVGLYVLSNKRIEAPLERITAANVNSIALVSQLSVSAGATVTGAKPATLIYRTMGAPGGDRIWSLDLTGKSDLIPRQVGSLSIIDGLSAPVATMSLCETKAILRKLDDPTSAFLVLTVTTNPNATCVPDFMRRLVIYPADSPTTAPREVVANPGTLEPVYGTDGTLAGLLLVNSQSQALEFFRDETFTNPTTVLSDIGGISALRDRSYSPWTGMAGSQVGIVIQADDDGGSNLYAVNPSGVATLLYNDSGYTSEMRIGANLYVQIRDFLAIPLVYQFLRIPVDGSSGPQLLWSYAPATGCYPDDPVGLLGANLILQRLCITSPGQVVSSNLLSAPGNGPGLPSVLASYAGSIYSVSLAQDRMLVTLTEVPTTYFSPDLTYSAEVLGANGTVLQSRAVGSVFPMLFADPPESVVQIRDIAGKGVRSGSMYKLLLGPTGALTSTRLAGMDGSPVVLSSDTSIFGSVIGVGAGRAYGTFGGGASETDLVYDFSRGLAVRLSVPGVSGMLLITHDLAY
jgi:hypothetical protein